MKKLALLLAIVFLSSCASNTSFNTFYQDHQEDSEFSLGLSSSLITAFLSDDDVEDIKPLLKKAKHVRILVFSENSENKSDKFNRFINKSKFEKMIKVKDDGDNVAIFTLENKDRIREIVVEVSTGDELVLLGLKTNLKEEDLEGLLQ